MANIFSLVGNSLGVAGYMVVGEKTMCPPCF